MFTPTREVKLAGLAVGAIAAVSLILSNSPSLRRMGVSALVSVAGAVGYQCWRRSLELDRVKGSTVVQRVVAMDTKAATRSVVDAVVAAGVHWVRVQQKNPIIVRAHTKALGGLGGAELEVQIQAQSPNETQVRMRCWTMDGRELGLRDDSEALVNALMELVSAKTTQPPDSTSNAGA